MEIKGKVISVGPVQKGQGKKGEWQKQIFVIETEGQYPKQAAITLWNDKVGSVTFDETVTASIDIESKEFNGKWYTEVKAWKVDVLGVESPNSNDDLPDFMK